MSKYYQNLTDSYRRYQKQVIKRDIDTFEDYYRKMQKSEAAKEWYKPQDAIYTQFNMFKDSILKDHELLKAGALSAEDAQDFTAFLDVLKNDTNSVLKKLMRTQLLNIYDTLAGDLDNPAFKQELNTAIALNDLYSKILNAEDKKLLTSFNQREAQDFLQADHNMNGNFSKTLKALYRKYQGAENEAERTNWRKLCSSYAVCPYIKTIRKQVKIEDTYNALPEAEKTRIRQRDALNKEAKALNQDLDTFVSLSAEERNKIRRNVATQNKIDALTAELKSTEQRYRMAHAYFLNAPDRIADRTASLQLSEKDSVEFRRMFGSLTKLRNTQGYHQMDQLMSRGESTELIANLSKAIRHTQNYIDHANSKSFFQKSIMSRRRLHAANETLRELTGLRQAILEETHEKFMQETKIKRDYLNAFTDPRKKPLNGNGLDFAEKAEEKNPSRVKLTIAELNKALGNNTEPQLTGWVIVEKSAPVKAVAK